MKIFGVTYAGCETVATPIGEICLHCGEPVKMGDIGVMVSFLTPQGHDLVPEHYACWMRQIIGSVSHIERKCGCYVEGSEEGDPSWMTKREAAEAALFLFRTLRAS